MDDQQVIEVAKKVYLERYPDIDPDNIWEDGARWNYCLDEVRNHLQIQLALKQMENDQSK